MKKILYTPELPPIVWTIAGSDNCGGAGIQGDLKTFAALGVHGCSVITSVTAQNSKTVSAYEPVSLSLFRSQLDTLSNDMPPRSLKIGMLGDADSIKSLAVYLSHLNTYSVYDPVMISSTGSRLVDANLIPLIKTILLPQIDLLTPNRAETEVLTGRRLLSDEDVETAAIDILSLGVKAVVIKGWDAGEGYVQDYYNDGHQKFWLTSPMRQVLDAHGTGCAFSAAHAAAHALGFSFSDAAVMTKAYVNQSVRTSHNLGNGAPFLSHQPMPCSHEDFPWLTSSAKQGRNRLIFPDCGDKMLGFYPIVDSYEWLKRLLPLGITTAQLRIKNKNGTELEHEIKKSISLSNEYNCRLFINDHWQLALRHGAYGVHLGQEDLLLTDIGILQKSGLRLGLSTHCYSEVACANALRPSYIAIGPIFFTSLKAMRFKPQGITAFRNWRQMLSCPLVAIGGISLDQASSLLEAGADGISVVSDITKNKDPEERTKAWVQLLNQFQNGGMTNPQKEHLYRSA